MISIHALREEGDTRRPRGLVLLTISIHALREEGDRFHALVQPLLDPFLSTPSARRATGIVRLLPEPAAYFYPRPPRGGRPQTARLTAFGSLFLSTPSARRATMVAEISKDRVTISIHALREEGD